MCISTANRRKKRTCIGSQLNIECPLDKISIESATGTSNCDEDSDISVSDEILNCEGEQSCSINPEGAVDEDLIGIDDACNQLSCIEIEYSCG